MALPSPGTVALIKIEDEENSGASGLVCSDEELRNKFWEDVKRRVQLMKTGSIATGSAQPPPPPPPPVQPPPPPSKLPPKAPPAHHSLAAKRLATEPSPPGFAGVRQPPPKQYQRRPPGQRSPAQPQQQPAPENAHRIPGPPPVNAQRAWHAPVPQPPAPSACRALAPSGVLGAMPPPLQVIRSAPRPPPPRHPAAKKKPTVPCGLCGVLCMTAWHLKQHERGRKHRNKVSYLAGEMSVQCPVCNVHLSGALNVQQHYAGKQHLLRLAITGGN